MTEIDKMIHPRKLEIVQAALECFLERGFHQTGVREIAKQAGISLGNLYNHFKGKEAVLVFIAELEGRELSEFVDLLGASGNSRVRLEQFINRYAAYVAQPENALLGVEILSEAIHNPVVAEVFGHNRNQLVNALVECLHACVPPLHAKENAREQANMILDVIEGYGLRGLDAGRQSEAAKAALLQFIIRGLGL